MRTSALSLIGLTAGLAITALAQDGRQKPPALRPGVRAGPLSLIAWSNLPERVSLSWPAVPGAERYRLTRTDHAGAPEIVIEELPAKAFGFEGASCTAGSSQPACVYDDVTRQGRGNAGKAGPPGAPAEAVPAYPHAVSSGRTYTYRAWAVFPGSGVSPPSPPATVQVK